MNTTQRLQIEAQAKSFMFDILMANPDLSMSDVLGVFTGLAGASPAPKPSKKAEAPRPPKKAAKAIEAVTVAKTTSKAKTGTVNTRTAEGRAAYDAAVLAALRELGGKSLRAKEIRATAGGTPEQFRASIDRAIEAGKASFEGKAAATRYSLA